MQSATGACELKIKAGEMGGLPVACWTKRESLRSSACSIGATRDWWMCVCVCQRVVGGPQEMFICICYIWMCCADLFLYLHIYMYGVWFTCMWPVTCFIVIRIYMEICIYIMTAQHRHRFVLVCRRRLIGFGDNVWKRW